MTETEIRRRMFTRSPFSASAFFYCAARLVESEEA